jgi:hypothetical protein
MGALEIVGLEWLGALGIFLGFILLVRYLDHRERMAMIDRGLVPPRRRGEAGARPGSASLRGGLITASVGLAVTVGLYTLGYLLPAPFSGVPGRLGPWLLPGLIPLGVGAALVASHYLAAPRPVDGAARPEPDRGADRGADHARTGSPAPRRLADWRPGGRAPSAGEPPAAEGEAGAR